MASIKFYCRECRTGKDNLAPIEMALNINGKRVFIPMPLKCTPEDFSKAIKNINSPISRYCSKALENVEKIMTEMMDNGEELTADSLKNFLKQGCVKKTYTLGDLFAEYLSIQEKRVGVDLSKDVYRRYVRTTQMFLDYNALTESIPANSVRKEHILKYQTELLKIYDTSTACNFLTKIKTIFKYGFETGKISSYCANGVKVDKGIKDTILYLTPEELEKIKNKPIINLRLSTIRDMFVFACYTGLAYADMKDLKPEDFKKDNKGNYYIDKRREKTGIRFYTILLPPALEIAQKYNFNFRLISNQKFNSYLKELADICGVDKELHCHVARHTAVAIFLNQRPALPMTTISRIFGWSGTKMAFHYASVLNSTIAGDMKYSFGIGGEEEDKYSIEAIRELDPNETMKIAAEKFTGNFKLHVVD